MKMPPFDPDELASAPPGKVRLADAMKMFETIFDDACRSIVDTLVADARLTDAERSDAIARVEAATENARLNCAEALLAKIEGRH
jgi:hypothetical protein